MSILIIGGAGRIAGRLAKLLTSSGKTVHSVIRDPGQADYITSLGATPHVHSIEHSSVAELADLYKSVGAGAIVWSAGAGGKGGPERTDTVDRKGAYKAIDAAEAAGVPRYIAVSAHDVRDRDGKPKPDWYSAADLEDSAKGWDKLPGYMIAKLDADRHLAKSGLDWTAVRPGTLTDDDATGHVRAGRIPLAGSISRDDVAAVVAELLGLDGAKAKATHGLAFDIQGGTNGDKGLPIREAVAKVASQGSAADTFKGYY